MKKLISLIAFFVATTGFATDINVKNISFDRNNGTIDFSLSWSNSWHNANNHDAAWVFVKFVNPNGSYLHGSLGQAGHRITKISKGSQLSINLPPDRVGVFIEPTQTYRGDVEVNARLKLDNGSLRNVPANAVAKVYAIEMVYIPRGGFTLGDPDPKSIGFASFFKSDASGRPDGLYKITSEDQTIPMGPTAGSLYYQTPRPQYQGDRKGTVPATFPKGVDPFYIMKYETTQGLYVDFLNTLSPELAQMLTPHEVPDYLKKKGSIRVENGNYIAGSRQRPCNYITWDDGASMADWAGLRPMTELEFTKAARGPGEAIPHEFPWNTDNKEGLAREVALTDELVLTSGISEANLSNQNRHVYGASYYWVMDLAGSLWEKCVTIGDPIGRSFKGTHGDGILSSKGQATNEDWPKGINEIGGYGYRGGGYYNHGMKVSEFNPHSPIAYRPYGSWAGGKRSIAYSQRYARTAPAR